MDVSEDTLGNSKNEKQAGSNRTYEFCFNRERSGFSKDLVIVFIHVWARQYKEVQ
jgi:hypothetical protein